MSKKPFSRWTIWRAKRQAKAFRKDYEYRRADAMYRATNGEHIPRLEREELNLPDWTA
jgi:hypothetical protein